MEYIGVEVSDEDFHTAMQIVDVLLEHSLLLSTSMDDTAGRIRPVKAFFKLRPVLKKNAARVHLFGADGGCQ